MPMPVVEVRNMRVIVHQGDVPMWMGMRLGQRDRTFMLVPVVLVVDVSVVMFERFVPVQVPVPLANQQESSRAHQHRR
jgi:hypothetical protein